MEGAAALTSEAQAKGRRERTAGDTTQREAAGVARRLPGHGPYLHVIATPAFRLLIGHLAATISA